MDKFRSIYPFLFPANNNQCPCLLLILMYYVFVDKQTYFENHYNQRRFYQENNLNQMCAVLSYSAFNSPFVANVVLCLK